MNGKISIQQIGTTTRTEGSCVTECSADHTVCDVVA